MIHSLKENYSKDHCFQYDMRLKNYQSDLKEAGLTEMEVQKLTVKDFEFQFVPKTDAYTCQKIKDFIVRHEWLGNMPHLPTHRFTATYRGHLAGVVIMATPNSFSNLLGKEHRDLEKLISRGASISWGPKNLGSSLVMYSIRWMAQNTRFRLFTAYSDIEARELGTIYQACNFTYLGQDSGARAEYFDQANPMKGWFSDRIFRKLSNYKMYAENLGITWQSEWNQRDHILWENMPEEVEINLREEAKRFQESCEKRVLPKKHKYVYILGRSKKETRKLKELLKLINLDKIHQVYPKVRGPVSGVTVNGRKNSTATLTESKAICRPWPQKNQRCQYMTLKEVSITYKVSLSMLYRLVNELPSFPVRNVGLKKKFVVKVGEFEEWLEKRSKNERIDRAGLPTADELLGGCA